MNAFSNIPFGIDDHLFNGTGESRRLIFPHRAAVEFDFFPACFADNHAMDRFDLAFVAIFERELGNVDPDKSLETTSGALTMGVYNLSNHVGFVLKRYVQPFSRLLSDFTVRVQVMEELKLLDGLSGGFVEMPRDFPVVEVLFQ